MKLIKWLKRDKSNRRSSDSQLIMVASPHSDVTAPGNTSADRDSIRSIEYKKCLAEFHARRSLDPNISFGYDMLPENKKRSPAAYGQTNRASDERRTKSVSKPKRRSLPETGKPPSPLQSHAVPQIQFLLTNQIFMPGNNSHKNNKKSRHKEKNKLNDQSVTSELEYVKGRRINFDYADDFQPPDSPPPDFFRENSLPYIDNKGLFANVGKDPSSEEDEVSLMKRCKKTNGESTSNLLKPLLPLPDESSPSENREFDEFSDSSKEYNNNKKNKDSIEDLSTNYGRSSKDLNESAETSFVSVARKLEETCRDREHLKPERHFRGIPLVRQSSLGLSGHRGDSATRALWSGAPVTVKGSAEGQYAARDIHILSTIRHPNILLLMGFSYDIDHKAQCVFEECNTTLYDFIHNQGAVLSFQSAIQYVSDIAGAIYHLQNNGFVHTAVSSHTIMLTARDVAKLCSFELCSRIINSDKGRTNGTKGDPYRLMFSSPQPEYENLKDHPETDLILDEKPPSISERYRPECASQYVSEREHIAKYNWQAPEFFDDVDGQVFPMKSSDVYSLCLVLWECCNAAVPWKSLSYKQLSDLYLLWQTGIRLSQNRYPDVVFRILKYGLPIIADERISISELCNRLLLAKNALNNVNDKNDTDDVEKSQNQEKSSRIVDNHTPFKGEYTTEHEVELRTAILKTMSKFQVTDIDNVEDDFNNSSETQVYPEQSTMESKSICINLSIGESGENLLDLDYADDTSQNMTMHKTDSTEYCSLLTPDLQKFASRLQNGSSAMEQSKLTFKDDSPSSVPKNSLNNMILRLNSSLTPKSYKSLHIKTPPTEKLENMPSLIRSAGSKDTTKSKYNFNIHNTSLPSTPIARSTKIRKYAWLSGENDDLGYNETDNGSDKIEKSSLSEGRTEVSSVEKIKYELFSNSTRGVDNSTSRISHENIKDVTFGDTTSISYDRSSFARASISGGRVSIKEPPEVFRIRSQSWSSQNSSCAKSEDESHLTGVDIKPLVAKHEKLIRDAKEKQPRSRSLPNNYRGSCQPVKPASHCLDPVLPANKNKFFNNIFQKKDSKKQHVGHTFNIMAPGNRKKDFKSKVSQSEHEEFYENLLWKKEKEKCNSRSGDNDPQGSSTPYKSKDISVTSKANVTNQSTNTETFDDLCQNILKQLKIQDPCCPIAHKSPVGHQIKHNSTEATVKPNDNVNHLFEKEKKVLMNELNNSFEDKTSPKRNNSLDNKETNAISTNEDVETLQNEKFLKYVDSFKCSFADCDDNFIDVEDVPAHHEGCLSHTETKPDDLINKVLKRCQAFSALQSARSTEDMYIDDELSVNNDTHALSEHMQITPIFSSIHEALCEKAKDCCLLRIKEEFSNNKLLIICDDNKNTECNAKSNCYEEDDNRSFPINNNSYYNFHSDVPPSFDHTFNKLPVIEEIPNDEELLDSIESIKNANGVQDLINMYEGVNYTKSSKISTLPRLDNKEDRSNEISFLILDNNTECDVDPNCDVHSFNSDSAVRDFITI